MRRPDSGRSICRMGFFAAVAALAMTFVAGGAWAAGRSLQVIVDASASMDDVLGGELKYKQVRAVAQKLLPRYDSRLDIGLTAFGYGDKDSCQDAGVLASPKPANAKAVLLALDAAKPKGMSPIAAALNAAAPAGGAQPDEILLIADGGDNCGGNVCSFASSLAAAGPATRVHVVGLGSTGTLRNLACLSEATKGTFVLVRDPNELEGAIDRVLLAAMTPPAQVVATAETAQAEAVAPAELPPMPARRPKHTVANPAKQPAETSAATKDETRAVAASEPPVAANVPAMRPEREDIEVRVVMPSSPTPTDEAAPSSSTSTPAETVDAAPAMEADDLEPVLPDGDAAPAVAATSGMSGASESNGFVASTPDLNIGLSETETPVQLSAFITEGGEQIRSGLIWRVYKAKRDANGHFELLHSSEAPRFDVRLPIGSYLVNLSWGRSHLTERLDVLSSKPMQPNMVLNAGGLRLNAQDNDGRALPDQLVQWRIFAEERDQSGNRQLLIDKAPGDKIIRLNAGIYRVASLFGTANGLVETDLTVQAGKLTDALVTHTAALVTFKLVNAPGGEALAGATWQIKSTDGILIKETGGALPTQILAAGDYQVEAQYSGRTFARKVSIEPGDPVHVEIVIQ